MRTFDRITTDPQVLGGRACIRDTRVSVSLVLKLVASGMTAWEIVEAYPYLDAADVDQALHYGAWLVADEGFIDEIALS